MKLRKSRDQGDLGYMIHIEGFKDFIDRYCMDIFNNDEIKIGEIKGYKLNVNNIRNDMEFENGRESFYALDALSQLCCNVWGYLYENSFLLYEEENFYFLNRFSFFEGFHSIEYDQELINALQKKMGAIIYSCGSTELEDDFPDDPFDTYWDDHVAMLSKTGWVYDEKYSFYTKKTVKL